MRCQGLWSRGTGGGGHVPTNSVRKKKCLVPLPPSNLKVSSPVPGCSLEIYMIAHDRRIAENTASDHQRLYGNTFHPSGDRQRLYENTFQRSWAILRFSDSSDLAIVSDHVKTRLYNRSLFTNVPSFSISWIYFQSTLQTLNLPLCSKKHVVSIPCITKQWRPQEFKKVSILRSLWNER